MATDNTNHCERRCWLFGPVCCHPAPRRAVDRRCPFWLEVYPALCARRHHSPKRYTKASRFQDTPGPMIAPGHRPGQIVQPPPLFWPIVHPLARGLWPVGQVTGPSARTLVPVADRLGRQVRGHWAGSAPTAQGVNTPTSFLFGGQSPVCFPVCLAHWRVSGSLPTQPAG